MAEIVVGVAASHTPQLSSGVDMWEDHGERDRTKNRLLGHDGEFHEYEELLKTAGPEIAGELTAEVWESKYQRAQDGIDTVKNVLAEAAADVAVVIGDDQWEIFRAEGLPTFGLFHGDKLFDDPRRGEEYERMSAGVRAAHWAMHGESRAWHRTDGALSRHITETLAQRDFDVFHFSEQREDRSLGHAFTFPRYRMGLSPETPIVPVFINTYFPPNVPSAHRCYQLGQGLRHAIGTWDADVRVAVVTSGGLSHFVVNEELDRRVLSALGAGDFAAFGDLPRNQMRSGNSEILNWVTAAGALEKHTATVVDYIPGYRSPAGTGTGMAFAYWK
ncbi:hypothetical protein [Streptomyces sp. NPDC048106]|uniref:DODA-type extradiol aromatic ring-opening family dioxygenase n=1 Tax=Streptomyces sp. NPDC048106 TaxID=3155750 RepID=UPI0034562FAA